MSAVVKIICDTKVETLLVPDVAVGGDKDGAYVMVRPAPGEKAERRKVAIGITDEKHNEVKEGLKSGETVVISRKQYQLPSKDKAMANPLMPFGGKKKDRK